MPAEEFVVKLKTQMENVHQVARTSLLEAGRKQKRLYDRRVSKHQYNLADAVWLRNYTRPKGLSKKLMMQWDGPFKIISKLPDLTYKIRKSPKQACKIVHFNRL